MNQSSKRAELKEPTDDALITHISNTSLYMKSQQQYIQRKERIYSLFQENFRVSADVAVIFAEDMVEVMIPEGRDDNERLLQMARERGIYGNHLPSKYVPGAVSFDLKAFKLDQLYGGVRVDRAEKTIYAIRCAQDLKQNSRHR
ncbi:hypothetical protein MP228_012750 [Amoeboaphelidium protococcarum]|nr:hypothetical protein MP228_012750 [Amoeboaphelidium protococcarum]